MDEFHSTLSGMDYEIFTTTFALAMWEIGELTKEQLQDIWDIVAKGASSQWNDVHSSAQKTRQSVLRSFLQKIEQPNLKIKKQKKGKQILTPLFLKGEVLAIPRNHRYRCIIFDKLYQYGEDAYYSFLVTTYNSTVEPTTETILLEEISVTKKTNTGEYGIRTLAIDAPFIEEHKTDFLKSGILHLDPKTENLGFSRTMNGFDDLYGMGQAMNDILLGEKVELYVCCLF